MFYYFKTVFYLLLFTSSQVFSQPKEEVIANHKTAMLYTFWQSIPTVEVAGSFRIQNNKELEGTFNFKTPDKWRFEEHNKKTTYAYNGTIAWGKTSEFGYKTVLLNPNLTQILSALAFFGSPIIQLDEKEIIYKALVKVDKISCYWLVHEKNNINREFFIAKETGLLFRTIISVENINEPTTFSITYLNYRNFSGIPFPTLIQVKSKELNIECVMNEIVLGAGMNDLIFDLPKM